MNYVGKILRHAGVCVVCTPLIERIGVAGVPITYGSSVRGLGIFMPLKKYKINGISSSCLVII